MGRRMHTVIAGSVLSATLCLGGAGLINPAVATAQPTIDLPEIPIPQPDAQQRAAILTAVLDATGVLINEVAAVILDSDFGPTPDTTDESEDSTPEVEAAPPSVGLGGSILPLPARSYDISSGYGGRNNPTGNGAQFHQGVDFAAPSGTAIYAVTGGTVEQAGDVGDGYGNLVRIKSGNTVTYYGHQSDIDVSVGDTVQPGDRIGSVGSTGNSTGPHLHFEVRNNGSSIEPVAYLKTLGIDPARYQKDDGD
ncbi:M23 family metallopeptidase [Rhodococcus sp. BP-252]|uniref:M23 family metallopeptidase n=1 Tax=unclassified Rhodococcus (in: high G+C Gram-positive bacteria) TaxID=192944 RepID=UPI001C9A5222|nr:MULTISPECIES: M23 family metallopeptidase [unclassified Rhodococcus (in: high G+C Gram-positive bacteria)]MBY6412142.1 M23 family metallopeptidase [Rhodococcus sp. BP-320]MBY6416722.1 M23 family metallopeptidase [Rhodococcus sp. BP-321]MBY6421089.1 M23 family metallopeptidase [Rhodococcus sp. BP-324]MBY6426746.1 M23 family metallopeptidase [Rhodococcus sp. BP-323]MBY6431745.1 M23 family metallopeptidase [Rhodococcus sp. BP-322]